MKECVIHIGTPKTGSSSIQSTLYEAMKSGRLNDVLYPVVKVGQSESYNHNFFSSLDLKYKLAQREFKSKFDEESYSVAQKEYWRDFSVMALRNEKIIISSEYLSFLNEDSVWKVRRRLEGLGFHKFKVVAYVRDPIRHYLSAIQQKIKASHRFSSPLNYRYKFREIIGTWSSVFPGSLHVRPFDLPELKNGCVVEDFISILNNFIHSDLTNVNIVRKNESLSIPAMHIIKEYRERFHSTNDNRMTKDSNRLVKYLSLVEGAKASVKPECAMLIKKNHLEDMAWLKEVYDIEFSSFDDLYVDDVKIAEFMKCIGGDDYLSDLSLVVDLESESDKNEFLMRVLHRLMQ